MLSTAVADILPSSASPLFPAVTAPLVCGKRWNSSWRSERFIPQCRVALLAVGTLLNAARVSQTRNFSRGIVFGGY
ncbi:hypothetical protein KCP76_15990 [Salmonella enterica subsp. enterica serovar Weltevreden]|nr:hypothetical protein KCP76_15990 [Salmonella enterica subsp. enterica serovar Weltevreden]